MVPCQPRTSFNSVSDVTIRIRNLGEFNAELREFGENVVPERHLIFQRRIALELLRRIVKRTPVDTGRARGNWQVNAGPADEGTVEVFGDAALGVGAQAINAIRMPFGLITIFNNVNYITFLEEGSSQQARQGMVAVSLAEVQSAFARGR